MCVLRVLSGMLMQSRQTLNDLYDFDGVDARQNQVTSPYV
jgi:hypothetical protein